MHCIVPFYLKPMQSHSLHFKLWASIFQIRESLADISTSHWKRLNWCKNIFISEVLAFCKKNRKWKWINRRKGNVRPRREKSASLASRMPRDCNPSHDPRAPGLRVASSSDVHLVPSWLSFEDLTSGILGTSWTGWRIDCNSSHGNQSQLGLSPVR